MAKYTVEQVAEKNRKAIANISQNGKQWAKFLATAAGYYNRSFETQALIFDEKPNATAVAPFDHWSERGLYIKDGTNGVPYLKKENGVEKVKYLFDIGDIVESENSKAFAESLENKSLKQQIRDYASQEFTALIAKAFNTKNDADLRAVIDETIEKRVADELKNNYSFSLQDKSLRRFLEDSVKISVYTRCGIDTSSINNDFSLIEIFNANFVSKIGTSITNNAKDILFLIGKQAEKYKESQTKENIYAQTATEDKSVAVSNMQNNNIIGNTPYRFISQKTYRKLNEQTANELIKEIEKTDYKYSGKINYDNSVTFTFSKKDVGDIDKLIADIKETRQSTHSFSAEEIELARKTNLVDFLQSRGERLKKVGRNEYELEEHDSMRINPDKGFFWNSQNTGGNALDFCIQYYGMDFKSAISELLRYNGYNKQITGNIKQDIRNKQQNLNTEEPERTPLPELVDDIDRVYAYLHKTRKISTETIDLFISEGKIAQDVKGNAVFKIYDGDGNLSGVEISGTLSNRRYKQTIGVGGNGFSFSLTKTPGCAIFFESAIDLMSFCDIRKNYVKDSLFVSMAGLKDIVVEKTLKDYGLEADDCYIASDFDDAGKKFAEKMSERYGIYRLNILDDEFEKYGAKDWNELLQAKVAEEKNEVNIFPTQNGNTQNNADKEENIENEQSGVTAKENGVAEEEKNEVNIEAETSNIEKEQSQFPTQDGNTQNSVDKEENIENNKTGNFAISDINEQSGVTAKEKYRNNINAIKTLLMIEKENRAATSNEQEVLSKYIGWGGLADVFNPDKDSWRAEYGELKGLLTPDEYKAASESVLNAHYTSSDIIRIMYKGLENLGFTGGKLLEPAMGNGRFFGCMPENLARETRLFGVELDSLTGRIAKQLYPNANIQITGFEKTNFADGSFDVAIGNVPFGDYSVNDSEFKNSGLIHDYFFKKALNKVKVGGIVAFISSKGTLDKKDATVRKYLAERADLLGAVRLPNNAFSEANTKVTSDIIFLQKRETLRDLSSDMPEWVNTSINKDGLEINDYFTRHPEMICGVLTETSGRFGTEITCLPDEDSSLSSRLEKAILNIKGQISEKIIEETTESSQNIDIVDINPKNYRNFSYAVINDKIYFRENSEMIEEKFSGSKAEKVKGLIAISEALRALIQAQLDMCSNEDLAHKQIILTEKYNKFTEKYGLIDKNIGIFRKDDTATLVSTLENINDKGELISKADIFTKRTIMPYAPVAHTDTASEALIVSISEKAKVDLDFISELCGKDKKDIIEELKGVIFENPSTNRYETADEYLSGNVREKLNIAKTYAKTDDKYLINVKALENAQPEDLKPSEISAQLGSTWIPTKYYQQFIYELLDTPHFCRLKNNYRNVNPFEAGRNGDRYIIMVDYDANSATFGISNKLADRNNIKATQTYGTKRMNAYKIIEETLNLKPIKIVDYIEDAEGKKRPVVNEKATLLAQEKQNIIKNKFQDWIFADLERTEDLCNIYNEKFNSTRPREYDGSHITFVGMNPEIKLRKHQLNAVAHTLYGGNTLLAHCVGAGKTFEMVASAMESKRLGLCAKSMIVVPKHIINQVAKEFLQLYPAANILFPSENDFNEKNRQKFCSRIATGNYDAVIISHTQLEKIPLSQEKQIKFLQDEIDEVADGIISAKTINGGGLTVKQLQLTKKRLEVKLEKLYNSDKKDTVINFEQLGIDKLYVDEAHLFKNRFFYTKMRNVSGISVSASQRAEDLAMKVKYLDELTGSKGVVFATGTPVSNSMAELFVMQSYLQRDKLRKQGISSFDAWASNFGETKISLELPPEGNGYQLKTRFAKFFNLPELMNMFREVADIQTAESLNLPVPKANYHTIVAEASETQKDIIDDISKRADKIRNGLVSADVDNMLKITNDGRKIALDQRLWNDMLPDYENSKVNECVKNVYEIYKNTEEEKSAQMIFCDLSTPNKNKFNVYDDVKEKLIKKGINPNEIAFIHDCGNDDQKKQELFTKVRNGEVRILLGSTEKMGTGTNCQKKLIALHHLDCPWRPADLEQRNGRIIRQGNENKEVDIFNYVTKGTFDSYMFQLVENKQRFVSQIMTNKLPVRSAEDIDETVLSFAQIKALCAGNPMIKEKMDLDIEVNRLNTVYGAYNDNKRTLQKNITEVYPQLIQRLTTRIENLKKDVALFKDNTSEDFVKMTIGDTVYTDKKEAVNAFLESCKAIRLDQKEKRVGNYKGFTISSAFDVSNRVFLVNVKGSATRSFELGSDAFGNLTRLENVLKNIPKDLEKTENSLAEVKHNLEIAKIEATKPFPQLEELRQKEERLRFLNKELSPENKEAKDKNNIKQKENCEKGNSIEI